MKNSEQSLEGFLRDNLRREGEAIKKEVLSVSELKDVKVRPEADQAIKREIQKIKIQKTNKINKK